jgi:hypothetical protein
MDLKEIKSAIKRGHRVYWSSTEYEVIKDKIGQYLIAYNRGGPRENYTGLTWTDNKTLNGKPSDFFTLEKRR